MARLISLTKEKEVLVDDEDYSYLLGFNWCFDGRYALGCIFGKKMRMHTLLMRPDKGKEVDHINRKTLDNRKSNLRVVTKSENCVNKATRSKTLYRGVYKAKNGFMAQASSGKTRIYLGYFKAAVHAAKAYDKFAKEKYGELAVLNFP